MAWSGPVDRVGRWGPLTVATRFVDPDCVDLTPLKSFPGARLLVVRVPQGEITSINSGFIRTY